MSAFDWSKIQTAETLEQSREPRFRPEMRPLLLQYFGLAPGMDVLEVGCGPGTLAPYLAEGLAPGTVTGLDLDERFIERARQKAEHLGLAAVGPGAVKYVIGDVYCLPFDDCAFDAVLSYTGLGVLEDPERALREMIRVCRAGGTVSTAEPVTCPDGLGFAGLDSIPGREPYRGAARYWHLKRRLLQAMRPEFTKGIGSKVWPVRSFLALLVTCGLTAVTVNAWGYCLAPDNARQLEEKSRTGTLRQMDGEISWLESLRPGEDGLLTDGPTCTNGFMRTDGLTCTDLPELVDLAKARRKWLEHSRDYSWEAGVSLVIMGRKPRVPQEAK
ncbi:MAG: class I SAM-dependent methyltransferase [Bacillota bacterium]|nr:class I SAM-dependent methyltransferase [Bacillota bacterium]